MTESHPLPGQDVEGIENTQYYPYDFDPAIRREIDRRTPGGRALSYLVSEWRDAVMKAAEYPGDAVLSEHVADLMNTVESKLEALGIQRTLVPPPVEEQ